MLFWLVIFRAKATNFFEAESYSKGTEQCKRLPRRQHTTDISNLHGLLLSIRTGIRATDGIVTGNMVPANTGMATLDLQQD